MMPTPTKLFLYLVVFALVPITVFAGIIILAALEWAAIFLRRIWDGVRQVRR